VDPASRSAGPVPEGRSAVRWGLGDFVWIYVSAVLVSSLLLVLAISLTGDDPDDIGALTLGLALLGQFGSYVGGLVWVSRHKGRGTLRADFGWTVHWRDWWYLLVGVGLELGLSVLVLVLVRLADERQGVVEQLDESHGLKLAVFALAAALVAPVCEELLFRGLLLRSLARRVPTEWAVGLSALVFALVHPLLTPTLGTLAVVPALFAFGAVSGVMALRTGDLSRSMFLHVGFNLLTTMAAVFRW
jgi:membrane protease YdiL (CAAX protease family)